jgi:hypothetical protein
MNAFDPDIYGPVCAALLDPARLPPLDAGRPDPAVRAKLAALTVEELFAGRRIQDRTMADACRAGLFLYHDCLDESHTISQEIETPTGSYWHGLMHRREPDFANSAYWFRRVGRHPVFEPLRAAAVELATASSVNIPSPWDPFWFINYCEACLTKREPGEMLARQIQQREWELLFDYCYRQAVGTSKRQNGKGGPSSGETIMTGPTSTPAGQTPGKAESPVDEMLRSLEPYRVVVKWPDYIRAYLEKYPELIPHVLPTVERARQEFGDVAELTLTVNEDPEIYDPYIKMYVSLPKYGPDTMARIDKVREPLGEATADLEGYFHVTTDHRIIGG